MSLHAVEESVLPADFVADLNHLTESALDICLKADEKDGQTRDYDITFSGKFSSNKDESKPLAEFKGNITIMKDGKVVMIKPMAARANRGPKP